MYLTQRLLIFSSYFIFSSVNAQGQELKFKDHLSEKQIDLYYDGKLLTAYNYSDSIKKPILFPINTISGITVTRGYPIAPRPGERIDHPHHTGMWLNYEYVNGLDFWNNSTAIPYGDRAHYGTIIHDGIVKTEAVANRARLEVTARWVDHNNQILLRESTRYNFRVDSNDFIIDRTTTLTALTEEVSFNDAKDGFLGLRVTRELELPSEEAQVFIDSKGNQTTVPVVNNQGVSGNYISSEGLEGNDVWGTRGRWVMLKGVKNDKNVSIIIIDNRKNIGYPTFWHARGYGLFAANPLGQEVFSKKKQTLNFKLKESESATFRYRVVIHEGGVVQNETIEKLEKDFADNDE
jgi:hypothetical protein